jgi:hypothetical protein
MDYSRSLTARIGGQYTHCSQHSFVNRYLGRRSRIRTDPQVLIAVNCMAGYACAAAGS